MYIYHFELMNQLYESIWINYIHSINYCDWYMLLELSINVILDTDEISVILISVTYAI